MAASDCVVTVTRDSELGKLMADLVPLAQSMEKEIERQRQEIAELRERIDKANAWIAEVRDGLDAWAGRIQALENVRATPESITRAIRMTTNAIGF